MNMNLEMEIKARVFERLGGTDRVTEIERIGVEETIRILSDFATESLRAEIPNYETGAPTRLIRIVQSYSGNTIDVGLFLDALRGILQETVEPKIIRNAALMEGILYGALVEHAWHETFSRRFATDAGNLQGIFEFRPGILPSSGE